jgi:hypothetical protein
MHLNFFLKKLLFLSLVFIPTLNAFDLLNIEDQYKKLIDDTIDWRVSTIKFGMSLENPKKNLSSRDVTTLHFKITDVYKNLRTQYWEVINLVKPISDYEADQIDFNFEGVNGPVTYPLDWYRSLMMERLLYDLVFQERDFFTIDLSSKKGQELVRNIKMGLVSAIILYDNYKLALQQFQNISKLRRLMNYDNQTNERYLEEVTRSFVSTKNFKAMVRAYNIYEKIRNFEKSHPHLMNDFGHYLDRQVESSYLYSIKDQVGLQNIYGLQWNYFTSKVSDLLDLSTDDQMYSASKFFGNTVGLVATRKGKLISLPEIQKAKLMEKLSKTLKPMDILLEKTPFRLTDKFIPGHWGHVAVWLGTEKQLKSLGLWSQLDTSMKKSILNGEVVLEALRPGVQVNTLEEFLNVDDLAIIRPNFIKSTADVEEHLTRAVRQIGKRYDFNFDVETDKEIVCSELAYVVYDDPSLNWPTEISLGRYTISPDHIAEKATIKSQQNSELSFTPLLLYYDGKDVGAKGNLQHNFEMLLDENYIGLKL